MRIEKDFGEFLKSLNKNGVKYLIVGGFAYSYYAEPKFTKDIDIWIERSATNAGKTLKAVTSFWDKEPDFGKADLLKPKMVIFDLSLILHYICIFPDFRFRVQARPTAYDISAAQL
jgi:hypothetical protein